MSKKAIIIGAGPAGLTAAYELLTRTDIIPIILEKSGEIGGISRTTNYKGNRMDMGPHRFFSKSDRVMDWWLRIMPLQDSVDSHIISYQNKTAKICTGHVPEDPNKAMVVIKRLTRIYFLRKFFAYPLQLTWDTLRALGFEKTVLILCSFIWAKLFPRRPEKNLEDFIINRFGKQLYLLFFKDYTEKVWGKVPSQISAEWGAQRIKGVSLSTAISSALQTRRRRKRDTADLSEKGKETSLIEQFLYPKFGTGSLWEEVARQIQEKGGQIYFHQDVRTITHADGAITSIQTVDAQTGQTNTWEGNYFFSTMPVQELIAGMGDTVPPAVREVAAGLQYRDFINVGLLLKGFSTKDGAQLQLKDNWIYVQERDVKVGRMMIYNNWGESMVNDPNTVWIGMEYFCNKTDALWFESDESIRRLAIEELDQMDLARPEDVLDGTVQRMEKTYPAYFGTYGRFDTIKNFTDQYANLFLVGRNGMHKYNNADHSMLCSMVAVDNIVGGVTSKANIWAINTEQEYHEEKVVFDMASKPPSVRHRREPGKYPFLEEYLWDNRRNRGWCIIAFALWVVEFVLYKFRYPYANFMPDSYSYLQAAATNTDTNIWPVAYSKFLRVLSSVTHHDTLITGLQYIMFQASSLLFLFTAFYFLRPARWVRTTLLVFILLNPIPLYICNYISADALFFGLSLCWLASLFWVVCKPAPWQIPIQALLLLACFTVRYNAIYYPPITIIAFLLSRSTWTWKASGISISILLICLSVSYTTNEMRQKTGKAQFSAFGGWQLANNALYMYETIPSEKRGPIEPRFAELETMVRQHMDTLKRVAFTSSDSANSFFYLWSEKGPLVQYMNRQWAKDSTTPYFNRWASEGPLYRNYALYLIQKYPVSYFAAFMYPNALKYVVPPGEFLNTYNMGKDTVSALAEEWFHYKTQKIATFRQVNKRILAVIWYPVFSALVNLLFGMVIFGLITFRSLKYDSLKRSFILITLFWLINMGFSIFASPVVLRYQALPILLAFTFALIGLDTIFRSSDSKPVIA